jgi:tetratricopeptide (TPR) repeat protein
MIMLALATAVFLFAGSASSATVPITTSSESARLEYLAGRDLTERLRGAEGVEHFRRAVRLDEKFALAHLALSAAAPTAKEGVAELEKAILHSASASEGERLLIQAAEAANAGKPLAARQHLDRLVKLYPGDVRAHQALGVNLFGQQDWPAAIDAFSKAITADRSFSAAYNMRGYAYRFNDDPVRAEADFRSYIRVLPNDPNPYDSLAEFLLSRGRYQESIQNYRKALEVRPDFVASYLGIAANLTYAGRYDDARKELAAYLKAARNEGQTVFGHWQIAAVYLAEGKYADAVTSMGRARALNRSLGDTLAEYFDTVQQGTMWLEAGELTKAEAAWKEAEALLNQARMQEGAREINRLNLEGNRVRLLVKRGKLAEAKTQLAKFEKGMKERSNAVGIRRASELNAEIAIAEKRWDDAVSSLAAGNPNNPYNDYLAAWALEQKGDAPAAAAKFKDTTDANQLLSHNYSFVRTKAKAGSNRLSRLTRQAGGD